METAAVEAVLAEVRGLIQADGGEMELVEVDDATATVNLRLLLDGVDCHECVMPRALLEDIAGRMLRKNVPDVARVQIDDPREHPGYVPPGDH